MQRPPPGPLNLLLVDAGEDAIDRLCRAMAELSRVVMVYPVESALRALAFLAKQDGFGRMPTPDLVVMDVRMPVIDGVQALAVMRASWPGIPVVMLADEPDEQDRARCLRLGAVDYLPKPGAADDGSGLALRLLRHCVLKPAEAPATVGAH